jgi:hypothetical protein
MVPGGPISPAAGIDNRRKGDYRRWRMRTEEVLRRQAEQQAVRELLGNCWLTFGFLRRSKGEPAPGTAPGGSQTRAQERTSAG